MVGPSRRARSPLLTMCVLLLMVCAPLGTLPVASQPEASQEAEGPVLATADPLEAPAVPEPVPQVHLNVASDDAHASTDDMQASADDEDAGHAADDPRFPLAPVLASDMPYVRATPGDIDDGLTHRARFVLDRNWGYTGSSFRAVANALPTEGIESLTWRFDGVPIEGAGATASFQVMDAGLHFLALEASWSDGAVDQVVSPIYVEDPVVHMVGGYEAQLDWDPSGQEWVAPALRGDVGPLADQIAHTTHRAGGLAAGDAPTVLLISDFVYPETATALALLPKDIAAALEPLPSVRPGGFGSITAPAGAVTTLGAPLPHVGQALTEALIDLGVQVVFASGIDATHGTLDRAAIHNALVYAAAETGIDAVVWGLPAAAHLPATVLHGMRPSFDFDQTPLFSAPPGQLVYGYGDWRAGASALPDYTTSVVEELWKVAYLEGFSQPEPEVEDLLEALWNHRAQLSPRLQKMVAAFRVDHQFDVDLQNRILTLGERGIPFVAPGEECPTLQGRPMTVLGVTGLLGTVTVAAGTRDGGAAPDSCQGPDRRATVHGTGIDFVVDPRPFHPDALTLSNALEPGSALQGLWPEPHEPATYVPNSLGAAARMAAFMGHYGQAVRSQEHPWKAVDLVGMVTVSAQAQQSPWQEGVGYLPIEDIEAEVPEIFPRQTQVLFSPYDPFNATAHGYAQFIIVGEELIAAAERLGVIPWRLLPEQQMRLFTGPGGDLHLQGIPNGHGSHFSFNATDFDVQKVIGPLGNELPDVAVFTLTLEAKPTNLWTPDPLPPPSSECLVTDTNIADTMEPLFQTVTGDESYTWEEVCIIPWPTEDHDARRQAADGQDCLIFRSNLNGTMGPLLRNLAGDEYQWEEVCIVPIDHPAPPSGDSEYMLPGLYTGHTWISTPGNGILQLPINIGVGSVFDVYRFLAPDKGVSDTAVCLALPLQLVADVTGLRATAMELDMDDLCIYWLNTDEHGVARFYTPLPLTYDLISFFSPQFQERVATVTLVDGTKAGGGGNGRAPPAYPQIHDTVTIPAPLNATGIVKWAGKAPDRNWSALAPDPGAPFDPVYVDGDLPYPLAFVYTNRTYPVAISVHWRYRDNVETTHILPVPSILSPEFLSVLQALPNPLHGLLTDVIGSLGGTGVDGLIQSAPDQLTPLVGHAQDAVKSLPVDASLLDPLLGQPVTRALPLSLQSDPGSCQWGYGHDLSPEVAQVVEDVYGRDPDRIGDIMAQLDASYGAETAPDTLVMRMQPTLEHALGLTTNLPVCSAIYPFNIPQPNEDSFFIHEFDMHLESSLLVVCITVSEVECHILAPNLAGNGTFIVDGRAPMDEMDLLNLGSDRTLQGVLDAAQGAVVALGDTIPAAASLALPEGVGLAADGHVALHFEQYTKDLDHGYLTYVAVPLDLNPAGVLDPLIGILEAQGLSLEDLMASLQVEGPMGVDEALADIAALLRDSGQEFLQTQPYVEVQRPVFFFDTWWWEDSFFDARVSTSPDLPRVGTADAGVLGVTEPTIAEDFWWLTFPNINQEYFRRGLEFWDPTTLQPDLQQMAKEGYPWNQPEFFEAVLEFWDDEEIDDIAPNQLHIHSGRTFHESVQSAKHCSNDMPGGQQRCFDHGFDFEEGDGWLIHDDIWGNGIYDPDQGLKAAPILDLGSLNLTFGSVNTAMEVLMASPALIPVFTPIEHLGNELLNLTPLADKPIEWWKRDDAPHANRKVYSDMYQNSSYFLVPHTKTCEERADLPHAVPWFTDQHPRWKADCPWKTAADGSAMQGHVDLAPDNLLYGPTPNGWHLTGDESLNGTPAAGDNQWWHHYGIRCEPAPWEPTNATGDLATDEVLRTAALAATYPTATSVSARHIDIPFEDVCGNFDGWLYEVEVAGAFDGAREQVWHSFASTVHPTFKPGTFTVDVEAWNECRRSTGGAACDQDHPIQEVWDAVAPTLVPDEIAFADTEAAPGEQAHVLEVDGRALVLAMMGLHDGREIRFSVDGGPPQTLHLFHTFAGDDLQELHATVPVDSSTDPYFGPVGSSEWPLFFDAPIFDTQDMSVWYDGDLPSFRGAIKQAIMLHVDTVRDHLESSPYWQDVGGKKVPFQDLMRPRNSLDPEDPPRLRPDGTPTGFNGCVGVVFHHHCRDRVVELDAGDLSVFGRAGYWGREAKDKDANIPQGSLYARWNREHFVRQEDATVESTRDHAAREDRGFCWFNPTDGHGEVHDGTHLEVRPFYTTDWSDPERAGMYNHNSLGRTEPVPPLESGVWCTNDEGQRIPAKSEREYAPMRLYEGVNGGDPDRTLAPPITPYVFEGGNSAGAAQASASIGGDQVTALLFALLNDVLGVTDGLGGSLAPAPLATATGLVGTTVPELGVLGINVRAAIPPTQDPPKGGSDVAPIAHVSISPDVMSAQLTLMHNYDFPAGTQGIFVIRTAQGWQMLPGSGSPGFTGSSGGETRFAFIDLSDHRGSTVEIGARILGDEWQGARWGIHQLAPLVSGIGSAPSPPLQPFPPTSGGIRYASTSTWDDIDAMVAGQTLVLDRNLTLPADRTADLDGVGIAAADCGGRACSLTVAGTLRVADADIGALDAGLPGLPNAEVGMPVWVTGQLELSGVRIGALLGGIQVVGGQLVAHDCYFVQSGHVAVTVLFGRVDVRRCVFADETVGIYAMASEVYVADNLFYRMTRNAGIFDDSWGVVRDNHVFHTKRDGFSIKGPLGAADIAVWGNHIEQTGGGINTVLSLEDRVLALDPRQLSVPVTARDRVQENRMEWNSLEAIDANALSAPVIYGNHETHSNVGVRVGWLDPAVIRYNTLYSDTYSWVESEERRDPADDGNVWAGLWQVLGITLPVDATDNDWGPGPIESGAIWPVDLVVHNGHVQASAGPAGAPLQAALTAPGYGGGLLPALGQVVDGTPEPVLPDTPLSPLVGALREKVGQIVHEDLMLALPFDSVSIDGFTHRNVTVHIDVAPDVQAVRLNGTFYEFLQPPDPFQATDLEGLRKALDELPVTDPARVLNPNVTRYHPINGLEIPMPDRNIVNFTRANITFQFDGMNESRALWRVDAVKVAGDWTNLTDEAARKDVVVHNSLTWPMLPQLAFLVQDIARQVLNDTVVETERIAAALLEPDPFSLDALGLGQGLLPDGTIATGGLPSLASLVRDQDPIRSYELQYNLSLDPLQWLPLDDGLDADRAATLPALEEGITMTVKARAMDASNLVSPWVGASILRDLHAPELDLDGGCIAGPDRGVQYEAREWVDPDWAGDPAYRPSGISKLTLDAFALHNGTSYTYELTDFSGPDAVGEWTLPIEWRLNGAAYRITGIAYDRAGHLDADVLPKVIVDLSAPRIEPAGLLGALLEFNATAFLNALDLENLTTLLRATVDDTPTDHLGLIESCGLAAIALEYRTSPDGTWHHLASGDLENGTVEADIEGLVEKDGVLVDLLSAGYLQFRVLAKDKAGHESNVTTPGVYLDVLPPLPTALPAPEVPALPVCLNLEDLSTFVVRWGAAEPAVLNQTGLQQVRLLAVRSDLSVHVLEENLTLDGLQAWYANTTWDAMSQLGDGNLVFIADALDRAGNGIFIDTEALNAMTQAQRDALFGNGTGITVDLGRPSINATGDNGLAYLAPVGDHVTDTLLPPASGFTGALPVDFDVMVSDGGFSCQLESLSVSLASAAGDVWLQNVSLSGNATPELAIEPIDWTDPDVADLAGHDVTVRLTARDVAGNTATANVSLGVLDLALPDILTDISLPDFLNLEGLHVNWTAVEETTSLGVSGIGSTWLEGNGAALLSGGSGSLPEDPVYVTGTLSGDGYHGKSLSLSIVAMDHAQNRHDHPLGEVEVDLVAPVLPPLPLPLMDAVADILRVELAGTDNGTGISHYDVVRYVEDAGVWAEQATFRVNGSSITEDPIAAAFEGKRFYYRVTPVDRAGNQGMAQETPPAVADVTVPVIDAPLSLSTDGKSVTLSFAFSDQQTGIDRIEVWRDDGQPLTLPGTATSFTDTDGAIINETVTYQVTAYDGAGHDATPPAMQIVVNVDPATIDSVFGLRDTWNRIPGFEPADAGLLANSGSLTDTTMGVGRVLRLPGAQGALVGPAGEACLQVQFLHAVFDKARVQVTGDASFDQELSQGAAACVPVTPSDGRQQEATINVTLENGITSSQNVTFVAASTAPLDLLAKPGWTGATPSPDLQLSSGTASNTFDWPTPVLSQNIAFEWASSGGSATFQWSRNGSQVARMVLADGVTLHGAGGSQVVAAGGHGTNTWDVVMGGGALSLWNGSTQVAWVPIAGIPDDVAVEVVNGQLDVHSWMLSAKPPAQTARIYDPMHNATGWTVHGTGSFAKDVDRADVAFMTQPGSADFHIERPIGAFAPGDRLVVYSRTRPVDSPDGTQVMRLETANGTPVVWIDVVAGQWRGRTATADAPLVNVTDAWHRIEVVHLGNLLALTVDQWEQVHVPVPELVAQKIVMGSSDSGTPAPVGVDRFRVESAHANRDLTFGTHFGANRWQPILSETGAFGTAAVAPSPFRFDEGTTTTVEDPSAAPMQIVRTDAVDVHKVGRYAAAVVGGAKDGERIALGTQVPGYLGDEYIVAASFRPDAGALPDGMAIVAGLAPTAEDPWAEAWTLELGRVDNDEWAVFYESGSTRTAVTDASNNSDWHHVRVEVNAPRKEMQLFLDEELAVRAYALPQGISHIAFGDLRSQSTSPSGEGVMYVADVAAHPAHIAPLPPRPRDPTGTECDLARPDATMSSGDGTTLETDNDATLMATELDAEALPTSLEANDGTLLDAEQQETSLDADEAEASPTAAAAICLT